MVVVVVVGGANRSLAVKLDTSSFSSAILSCGGHGYRHTGKYSRGKSANSYTVTISAKILGKIIP